MREHAGFINHGAHLAILERLGKRPAAEKIVHRLAESWFRWEKDPAAYDRARAELAQMIVEAAAKKVGGI